MTDAGLALLKGLPQLQMLYLYGTQVTDAGLAHLKGLSRLRRIGLSDTQVTGVGVARLKVALPTAEVRYRPVGPPPAGP